MGDPIIHTSTSIRASDNMMERVNRDHGEEEMRPGGFNWNPGYCNTKNLQSLNAQDLELVVFNMMKTRKERELMPCDIEMRHPR